MIRVSVDGVSVNWKEYLENAGVTYHTKPDGSSYWTENHCYVLTEVEIDRFRIATEEVYAMMLNACEYYLDNHHQFPKIFNDDVIELIKLSFNRKDFTFYGRFDFGYNGKDIKLFELNSDTAFTALEAGPLLTEWCDLHHFSTKHNILESKMLERLEKLKILLKGEILYFTCYFSSAEDRTNMFYIQKLAQEVGIRTSFVEISNLRVQDEKLYDSNGVRIHTLFKFYPWDYIIKEVDVSYVKNQIIIEPLWRIVMYKCILPIMSLLYPDHPLLLKSSFYPIEGEKYIRKPMFLREGYNVELFEKGVVKEKSNTIFVEHQFDLFVYQKYFKVSEFDGYHPVIGSWIVGDSFAGIGIRESKGPITDSRGTFVPFYVEENVVSLEADKHSLHENN